MKVHPTPITPFTAEGAGIAPASGTYSPGIRDGFLLLCGTDLVGAPPADHLLTNREGYVSLAQLAAEHEMSVSHLQKLFKQVYGVPVYRYIKEYRLEQAAVELVRSRKPITEIAQRAGYDNASKFSESFKKRYGKRRPAIVPTKNKRQNGA